MPPELAEAPNPSDQIDEAASAAAVSDAPAESSTAKEPDVKEAPDLLGVLRDAVQPAEQGEQPSAPAAENKDPAEGKAEDKSEAKAEDPVDPDDSKLPFGKHPRWKEVLNQRNTARTERDQANEALATTRQELEELRYPAEEYRAIETFRQAANLETKEVAQGLQVMALVKNDPDKALEALFPIVDQLLEATGRKLPDDLRKDVEEGRITEERARELSRATAASARAEERARTASETAQAAEQRQAADRARTAIVSATEAWEAEQAGKDPDFAKKQPLIMDRVQAIAAREKLKISTPEEAVALAKRAYKDVSEQLRKAIPPRQEIRPRAAASPSVEATPEPKTMKDAMRVALGR